MAVTPSHRPTREWPLLLLAVTIVAAVCAPLWPFVPEAPEGSGLTRWTSERLAQLFLGPEQAVCYACCVWSAFILLSRYREVRRQRKCFSLELLPREGYIVPEDARLHQRRIDAEVGTAGPFFLAVLLKQALGKYAITRTGRDVSDTLRAQTDLQMGRMISSMALVHYLAWAIPAVGFLGTVRGLAGALSLGSLAEAKGHLYIAFDCTLVALALSLITMLLVHLLQREEEALLLDCEAYAQERLVARLYDVGPESASESTSLDPASLANRSGLSRRLVT